jgi:acyl-coenzyme A synthetase/AMP-(fatty) acid ligase
VTPTAITSIREGPLSSSRSPANGSGPKWIRTVAELPRTATGKVQRYKLREILERELQRSG